MSGTEALELSRQIEPPRLPLEGGVFLLLTAAGASSRFGGTKKELLSLGGESVLRRSLSAFLFLGDLAGVAVTYPEGKLEEIRAGLRAGFGDDLEARLSALPCGLQFVAGGATRQASVSNGLEAFVRASQKGAARRAASACPSSDAVVLVHDAARPWVAADTVRAVLASARAHGACIPLCDLPDTPKFVAADGFITSHPKRDDLKAAQTPQGFALGALAAAHRAAAAEGWSCTDDASVWDRYVGKVAFVKGDRGNRKITYREDLPMQEEKTETRIGEGWDIHPLVAGRALILGGVAVDHDKGEAGHSDGDVLWHAIIDAILGAASLADIGAHFPPSDARWKDADSSRLAALAWEKVSSLGWTICNIDSTVILERPKLGPHREAICASIARALGIPRQSVSVKAKTNEGFGEIGAGNAIEARAVALLSRKS